MKIVSWNVNSPAVCKRHKNRILSLENGKVIFLWRNYAYGGGMKPMTLDAEEFIRRFLLHILPSGEVCH